MKEFSSKLKTPMFPPYKNSKFMIQFLNGRNISDFKDMWDTFMNLKGTPQKSVNWSNPDEWIYERLSGVDRKFANEIWISSRKIVNPRYVQGIYFLWRNYNLLTEKNDKYILTEDGRVFIKDDFNKLEQSIDQNEGCVYILYLVSGKNGGTRKDYLKDWESYLQKNSNYRAESVIKDSLRRRMFNLADRSLLERDGNKYSITTKGKEYLKSFDFAGGIDDPSEEQNLHQLVDDYNKRQKALLKEKLFSLDPILFEHLVKDLLDGMGYEDVEVTSPTNDKGVDVLGTIQLGISNIKEVVQVKRTKSNVPRTVLDQLRGSLHRFDAFQGTIITISDFSKGTKTAAFEKGAAPITLINGDKLIDLLFDNEIVVNKESTDYYTIDQDYFESETFEINEAD